jgi:acyl-CoA synthetase (AMP-forming)/AMP-acid ligase II
MKLNGSETYIGIVARNSRSFARHVLRLYRDGVPFVVLKSADKATTPIGARIREMIDPDHDSGWIKFERQAFSNSPLPAQISFTSGTEGRPKAIVHSQAALADVVERLNKAMGLNSGVREYIGVPAYFSFGLGRIRACAEVGGCAYLPPGGFNPVELSSMVRAGEVNAVSAVPTLWRTVLSNPELFEDVGKSVLWIEIGSQYMSRGEKEQLKRLFPNAQIVQHYGLTEASRSTFLDISGSEGEALESVGAATGGVGVRVSREGRVQIRGPHVAMGVLTERGLMPLTDADGWLTTGDRGEMRDGLLFYLGRDDDLINCGGVKLEPELIERRLLDDLGTHAGLGVGRFPHPIRGDGIVACIEESSGLRPDAVRAHADRILLEHGLRAGDALVVRTIQELPRTQTGKLQRQRLADLAGIRTATLQSEEAPYHTEQTRDDDLEMRLIAAWKRVLKADEVSTTTNFYDSGGDSLTAIGLMLALERSGIDRSVAQRIFDGETIAEIAGSGLVGQSPARNRISERVMGDVINIVRGVLVLILIGIHFLPGVWERLPVVADAVNAALHPFYRLGTPGFALVFGLGVGFFYFRQMSTGTANAWRRIRLSAAIVLIGMIVLGLFRVGAHAATRSELPAPLFSSIFYSVLAYYLFAVLSIPLWYRLVVGRGSRSTIVRALAASCVSYLMYMVLDRVIGPEPFSFGPAEFLRLMFEAKYNYFRMTAIVMAGIAIGLHYREQDDLRRAAFSYLSIGAMLVTLSAMIPPDMGQPNRWLTMQDAELFSLIGYTGLVLMLLGIMNLVGPALRDRGPASLLLRILAACGILSLPSYVAHGLVLPGKEIISKMTGLSPSLALLGALGLFVLMAAVAVRKVVRMYG